MVEAQDARPPARPHLPLELLPDTLAVCRLEPGAARPFVGCGAEPIFHAESNGRGTVDYDTPEYRAGRGAL